MGIVIAKAVDKSDKFRFLTKIFSGPDSGSLAISHLTHDKMRHLWGKVDLDARALCTSYW